MHYARAMKITAEDLLLDRTVERYVIILKLFEINFTAMPLKRQFDLIHSKTIINSESKKTRFFIRYYELVIIRSGQIPVGIQRIEIENLLKRIPRSLSG